ncbi:hypothetical protein AGABI1DRAFT_133433 [Agaricus bisporus var. burnettii JB137-S8]|uniref:Uncharacterized protein n=1 Tax=Agaricus bisporus var. burnettii (strain JB137-S8 / ATCC MYA-4627 / FGSC 10392) TaxID=597362 RepID=K5WG78_AGABU|nr:uncharacterized protein AGABI1DRAFT_133433 [Agaricus bisporus var. burnettii JB137-S8]EKM74276.1 hypothetical protein AGABI1DRAFT_133433 [Agaricus bisporus var. burnettii JB137-S8]
MAKKNTVMRKRSKSFTTPSGIKVGPPSKKRAIGATTPTPKAVTRKPSRSQAGPSLGSNEVAEDSEAEAPQSQNFDELDPTPTQTSPARKSTRSTVVSPKTPLPDRSTVGSSQRKAEGADISGSPHQAETVRETIRTPWAPPPSSDQVDRRADRTKGSTPTVEPASERPRPTPQVEPSPITSRLRDRPKMTKNQGKGKTKSRVEVEDDGVDPNYAEVDEEGNDPTTRPKKPLPKKKGTKGKGKAKAVELSPPPSPSRRLFASGVSIPLLPHPVATSFHLPPTRGPPIEPTTGYRRIGGNPPQVVNNPRSQAELRHNMGSIGTLLIRDELRNLFVLPETHSLRNAVKCTNCIIKAKKKCGPPIDFIGSCAACKKGKASLCSFVVDAQAELTVLGQLNDASSASSYNLGSTTQALLADQAAIHLTLASLQSQITRAALNIESYAHEWRRQGAIHGARRLAHYGLARSTAEVQDFLDFLESQKLGTDDITLSARLADQQRVISRIYQLVSGRPGDPIRAHQAEMESEDEQVSPAPEEREGGSSGSVQQQPEAGPSFSQYQGEDDG